MSEKYLPWYKNPDWVSSFFLLGIPALMAVWIPIYFWFNDWHWGLLALFLVFYVMTTLSITAGYHRFLAHRAYDGNKLLKFFFIFIGGPAAFQGSALEWCSDHRRHHTEVDTDQDPYNIKRGFFYAHLGWMLEADNPMRSSWYGPDLKKDKWVMFQHRHYILIAISACFLLPMAIGWTFGAPIGGLIIGGGLRLVLAHHATFFINSLCHTFGRQPYNDNNSAKDSFIMAVLTQGEGYHNFHHRFAGDYRNGIRWYDYDPTKWFIQIMSLIGWARNLKVTSPTHILKAKLGMDEIRLLRHGVSQEKLLVLKKRVEEAQIRFRELKAEYRAYKKQWKHTQNNRLDQMKRDYRNAKHEFKLAWQDWQEFKRYGMAV